MLRIVRGADVDSTDLASYLDLRLLREVESFLGLRADDGSVGPPPPDPPPTQ